ncbi:MAG: hypothetical protein ACWA5W_02255 [Phycisphaerales bacterium]
MVDGTVETERDRVMSDARRVAGEPPCPRLRSIVCPYCGELTEDRGRCGACHGRFDPLSRQATQNQMGPWAFRDDQHPNRPGCSYETMLALVKQGKIRQDTVVRGPSTHQFWTLARQTPGIAQLLGVCHSCQNPVKPEAFSCPSCFVAFSTDRDRQHLGLGPFRPLPGRGQPAVLAMQAEPAHVGVVSVASVHRHGGGRDEGAEGIPELDSSAQPHDPDIHEQLDLARRSIKRWKRAVKKEQFHARVVMGISIIIALMGLLFGILQMNHSNQSGSGQVDQTLLDQNP